MTDVLVQTHEEELPSHDWGQLSMVFCRRCEHAIRHIEGDQLILTQSFVSCIDIYLLAVRPAFLYRRDHMLQSAFHSSSDTRSGRGTHLSTVLES